MLKYKYEICIEEGLGGECGFGERDSSSGLQQDVFEEMFFLARFD